MAGFEFRAFSLTNNFHAGAARSSRFCDSSAQDPSQVMAASPKRVRSADAKKERGRERTKKKRTASSSSSRSSSAASGSSSSGSSSSGSSSSGSSRSSSSSSSSSSRSTSVSPRRGRNRPSRSESAQRARRKRSPSPPRPCKIHVGRLTRNVTRDHLLEIFGCYGTVKGVELPPDRTHGHLSRGFAYVEFENPADAERAMRHMDGGQIDGQEVTAASVLLPRPMPPRRPSPPAPPRRPPAPPPHWRRSPPPRPRPPRRSPPPSRNRPAR
ncbi:RNA-binding protein with serine-rich domain 1-B [Ixodes scapularis]